MPSMPSVTRNDGIFSMATSAPLTDADHHPDGQAGEDAEDDTVVGDCHGSRPTLARPAVAPTLRSISRAAMT